MLKNYLKIAFRNLFKNKLYSFINIFGLAVSLGFCVLVLLYINDELSYDHFHQDKENIYRVYRQPVVEDTPFDKDIYMPMPVGQALKNDIPEVDNFVRLTPFGSNIIRHNGELIEQNGVTFADPALLEIFSFPLLHGEAATALASPGSVVITEDVARKYFGTINALGKLISIRLNNEFKEFEVTAVLKAIPSNSTLKFKMILPTQALLNNFESYASSAERWDATRSITYVRLLEGADINLVHEKMPGFIETYFGDMFDEMREDGTLRSEGPSFLYQLQPLLDIHLNPDFPGGFSQPSNPTYSYILGGIALAVLLIACFNFMILSIGRFSKRAREVGLRKVVGAVRKQLMFQFWGEAYLIIFIAFLAGIVIAELSLPVFNNLSGKDLSFASTVNFMPILGSLIVLFLFTGFMAGSYPALVLSSFKPVNSLKEKLSLRGANSFTKSLIVIQFSFSLFLVAATLVMTNQLHYMQQKNLGFSGEQVLVIPANGIDGERTLKIFRDELQQDSDIVNITGANVSFATGLWRRGYRYDGEIMQSAVFRVDANYLKTLQMNLVAGRDFNPLLASDSTQSIIVNQAFLRKHGLDESIVGESFPIDWGWMVNPVIIGVVEDFNYQSLQNQVEPVMIYMNPRDPILNILVRIRPENMSGTIAKVRNTWNSLTNEIPFSYSFLDEDMDNLYRSEEQWSKIVFYSSFFAIFIACLGLFALTGITSIQRQKEIGIRKVLGASMHAVVLLLSKDFTKLVLISIVIATPVAWYALSKWLQNFAYRIDMGVSVFVLAGAISLAIALITVSFQAVKTAMMNPIKSLKNE